MAEFDHSSDTTRKIETLRRMAVRLENGEPLKDPSYLNAIADEMERVYRLMIERAETISVLEECVDSALGNMASLMTHLASAGRPELARYYQPFIDSIISTSASVKRDD